jgi:hypothetical protein
MNRSTRVVIETFLDLPAECLPSADWLSPSDDLGSVWDHLRDIIKPEDEQEMNHTGEKVRLHADSDGFRQGVIITLR